MFLGRRDVTILAAILAQIVHSVLMLAAAPVVSGVRDGVQARLAGRTGPDFGQPWRDLRRMIRKQPALAETATLLPRIAPVACFAAAALAAMLVPSFTLGMALAPYSDLLVVAGLLAASRIVVALAALDAGTAPAGLAAGRSARLACLAEPTLYLAIFVFGVLGGTTNVDLLCGLRLQGMLQPVAAAMLAVAALALAALAGPGEPGLTAEFSGADLALVQLSDALGQLVWLSLLAGLLLPAGMAKPGDGPLGWVIGLLAWGAKILVLTACLAALRAAFGGFRPSRRPLALGIAAILGLLAALLVLASAVAA
ncbi:MAG TPA: NADH-quinone oxidoreductase subunit H [Acetobacteraceae bacterium]|nr:NADH-quinone oxidoreductase subunit H [Acetobacteraceae bacterium]